MKSPCSWKGKEECHCKLATIDAVTLDFSRSKLTATRSQSDGKFLEVVNHNCSRETFYSAASGSASLNPALAVAYLLKHYLLEFWQNT